MKKLMNVNQYAWISDFNLIYEPYYLIYLDFI